jgi:replicative DNA helicase
MAGSQIAQRAASQMARIDLRRLRSGEADAADYDDFTEAAGRLAQLDWHVDDRPQPTFAHIAARCQQVQATDGLSFVAVDYDEKIDSQGQTEEQRVASIARGLKDLAKRFGVPVVALSQYSRKASENTGVPSDHWLRYSGKKEQESALILHWYWPGYFIDKGMRPEEVQNYNPSVADGKHGRGWMVCTKNRFGRTGKTQLYFQPEYTRFIDPQDPEADTHGILPDEPPGQEPDLPTTEQSPF